MLNLLVFLRKNMQNVLVSALEQENRTLIDRVIKLETKIQQNEAMYLKSQTSAALASHDKTLENQTQIRALQDLVHQLQVELARAKTEHVGQQTKCANIEKALQLSEKAKNDLIFEVARLKRVIIQYQSNEELLTKAVSNYINVSHNNANDGRLVPTLPSYMDGDTECPCLDHINRSLYAIVALLNASKNTTMEGDSNNRKYQVLYMENERLRAEIITTRAQLETEKTERRSLLEDVKESFNQLKNLQVAQLEIRENKTRELEDRVLILESALRRKQETIDELLLASKTTCLTDEQIEKIKEKQKEEIRANQRDSFTTFAEATLSELTVNINKEKTVTIGDDIRGLRRVSFDSKIPYSSPASPAFNSISKPHAKVPISKNQIDSSIMSMATKRRLSVLEAADTVRSLTE